MRRSGLKGGFLLSTSVMMGVIGYGRRAYAACTIINPGPPTRTIACSGIETNNTSFTFTNYTNINQSVTVGNFTVFSTDRPLDPAPAIAGNQITVTGDGNLLFNGQSYVVLEATEPGFSGVRLQNTGVGGAGNVTFSQAYADPTYDIYTEWGIFGTASGVTLINGANGDITATVNGLVRGEDAGLIASHTGTGNIVITTGENSEIEATGLGGTDNGINADHDGTGSITITVNGDVRADGGTGVLADNGPGGTGITVNLGDGEIEGAFAGLGLVNGTGTGGVSVQAVAPTSSGSVYSSGGNGIDIDNDGDGGVDVNLGDIGVEGDPNGIYVDDSGTGAVSVTVNGTIDGGTTGINVLNSGGSVTVETGDGDVTGDAEYGILINNLSSDAGAVTVTTGSGTVTGGEIGLYVVSSANGGVEIDTTGDVVGEGSHGIRVSQDGEGLVDIATGAGNVSGTEGHGISVYQTAGDGVVVTTGAGTVTGDGGLTASTFDGINIDNYSGYVEVTTGTGAVTGDNDGIDVYQSGSGAVTIETTGDVTGSGSNGILVNSSGLSVTVTTGAGDVSGGGVFGDGINVYSTNGLIDVGTGAGDVSGTDDGIDLDNRGDGGINVTTAGGRVSSTNGDGIFAYDAGDGGITVETGAGRDVGAGVFEAVRGNLDGIDIQNEGGGAVGVTTGSGKVIGETGDGVLVDNYGDGGVTVITGAGDIIGGEDAGNTASAGIDVYDAGAGGIVITVNDSDVTGDTDGISADNTGGGSITITTNDGNILGVFGQGIDAYNNGGTGAISISTNDGTVTGNTSDGIYAYNSGDGGITVTTRDGAVTGGANLGDQAGANGIELRDSGDGGVTLTVSAGAVAGAVAGDTNGIIVSNYDAGNISITTNAGDVTGTTESGIRAYNGGGTGNLTITLNSTGKISGDEDGISAESIGEGLISINTGDGDITGDDADGIRVDAGSDTTTTTITVDGLADVTGGQNGISVYGNGGAISVLAAASTGVITGEANNGIDVGSSSSQTGGITITTGAGAGGVAVLGDQNGIYAYHRGSTGLLQITTGAGSVTGTDVDGIYAANAQGTGVTILTAAGAVDGGDDGIDARNGSGGAGAIDITTAAGDVTGADDGIYADNNGNGGIEITTANSLIKGETSAGIEANDSGTGNVVISTGAGNGAGLAAEGGTRGIEANNTGGGYIDITVNNGDILGGSTGIAAYSYGSGTDITVTLAGSGDVTGTTYDGINAINAGYGSTTVDLSLATGRVTGEVYGIYAYNTSSTSGGITITTGAGRGGIAVYSDQNDAIRAENYGSGVIEITTAAGAIESDEGDGIAAYGFGSNDGITIETGSGAVTGGQAGINAYNYGGTLIQITTADGLVEGENADGIYATNDNSGDVEITTGDGNSAGLAVRGNQNGIAARIEGLGSIDITIGDGDITGTTEDGIYAYTNGVGDIDITLTGSADVTGGQNGIAAFGDDGQITIDAEDATGVIRGNARDGIFAYAYPDGDDVTITTGVGAGGVAVVGQDDGIEVYNLGSGDVYVTTGTGSVTGTAGNGIEITGDDSAGSVEIETGTGTVQGAVNGIFVSSTGVGSVYINTDGRVVGLANDGIYVQNGGYNSTTLLVTGTEVEIKTNAAVEGKDDGISVNNDGLNGVTIKTYDEVTGEDGNGIYANSGLVRGGRSYGGGMAISTYDYVYGGTNGIYARNTGGTGMAIYTSDESEVRGDGGDGINARSGYVNNGTAYGNFLTIETNALVSGSDDGIYARNIGATYLTITTKADVIGEGGDGIIARNGYFDVAPSNFASGTNLIITTQGEVLGQNGDGIDAQNNGSGELVIRTYDLVDGDNGDGIYASNGSVYSGTIRGTNLSIYADAEVIGSDNGIYAVNEGTGLLKIVTQDDVTGENGDGIFADGGVSGGGSTLGGGIEIDTYGIVTGEAGDGIHAYNNGPANIDIYTEAAVYGEDGDGIYARNGVGQNNSVYGGNIVITTEDLVTGSNRGITALNDGYGYVVVETNAAVTGEGDDGIYVQNGLYYNTVYGGRIEITTYDTVTGETSGIRAINRGNGSLVIDARDVVTGNTEYGIEARNGSSYNGSAYGSYLTIDAAEDVTGALAGIYAQNFGDGLLTITTQASVTGTDGDGITARGGTGSPGYVVGTGVEINTYGTVTGEDGDGIDASNIGNGNLDIYADAAVYGENGAGILAKNGRNFGGTVYGSNLIITTNDIVTGATYGIYAENTGIGYTQITTNGVVTGEDGDGIFARNGTLTPAVIGTDLRIYANEDVFGQDGDGIDAENRGLGSLTIITRGVVDGDNGQGISAFNGSDPTLGGTDLTLTTYDDVTGSATGILAFNQGSGDLTVTIGGDVTGETVQGIVADNSDEGNEFFLTTQAGTTVTGAFSGIVARNYGTAEMQIDILGTAVTGTTGSGLQITFDNGTGVGADVDIGSTATVSGLVAAISVVTDEGKVTDIDNDGVLRNLSGNDFSQVLWIQGSAAEVVNDNVMTGFVTLGGFNDLITNNSIWNTGGGSSFGAGTDRVLNTGTLIAANSAASNEVTQFLGLETFDNDGIISLSDQSATVGPQVVDVFQISGNFNGISGALQLDAFLEGASSNADTLVIDGTATGVTNIVINNTNNGPGAVNANILLVNTGGATGSEFVLADGPIIVGAYVYDLFFDAALDDFFLRSALDTLRLDAATLPSIIGDVWEITASSWHRNTVQLQGGGGAGVTRSTNGATPAIGGNRVQGWGTVIFDTRKSEGTIIADVGGADTPLGVEFDQNTSAVIGGVDLVLAPDANGGTLTFGALLGVIDSTVDFDVTGNSAEFSGPTYGVHVAYANDRLRADLLVKRDDLELEYTVAGLGEDPGEADAVSTGVSLEFGYLVHQGDQVTIEAVGNLSHVSTKIDSFTVGTSTFDFEDGDTTRGAIGVTFRGNYALGGTNMTPSATIKYWNVFDGGYTSAIDATTFSYENTGGYVEASATLEFNDPTSGWSGFVTGTGFVGDERSGARAQVGVNLEW